MKKVLIIDDSKNIHDDFDRILKRSKSSDILDRLDAALFNEEPKVRGFTSDLFSVDHAYQGAEGVEKIIQALKENNPYSIVFVDMRMPPGLDGLQTIQEFWNIDSDIQIVICTAYADYSFQDIFDVLGETDRILILKKPFDPIEVEQMVYALHRKWVLHRFFESKEEALEEVRGQEITALQHEIETLKIQIEDLKKKS